MPLQATSGAASYDAFGGGVAAVPNYIEEVFATHLYTGTSPAQTITNGIDLAGKGGLVWSKARNLAGYNHALMDTARSGILFSDTTQSANDYPTDIQSYNSNGFTLKDQASSSYSNIVGTNYASWTFREAPKFFDVVTYTGDGTSNRQIAHNLGSVPGCVIIKKTNDTGDWTTWHTALPTVSGFSQYQSGMQLNTTAANDANGYLSAAPTSTYVQIGTNRNGSGDTFVMYLFAHNAGGFGLTGTDNVISCGSYTGNGGDSNPITLGYEPQWIMVKNASNAWDWAMFDNMRGVTTNQYNGAKELVPNASSAESTSSRMQFSATGFNPVNGQGVQNASGDTYIYIAIRRGPMKVPTDGTKVFNTVSQTPSGTTTVTNSFASDMVLSCQRSNGGGWGFNVADKLRGSSIASGSRYLTTPTTAAEGNFSGYGFNLTNTNVQENFWNSALGVSTPVVYEIFQRAPGFFDEVCWTGDNTTNRSISHNLQAAPELIIRKSRSASGSWSTLTKFETSTYIELNLNSASEGSVRSYAANQYLSAKPTSTVFTVNSGYENDAGVTYVSYLFATCPGVSKVGFYTGTGTTQAINCGFTAGSRFVLIKRYDPDSTGDWYVWDSARGIVAGTDPRLALNSTAAEVNANWVYATTGGFEIVTSDAAVNASGGSYIFLSVA